MINVKKYFVHNFFGHKYFVHTFFSPKTRSIDLPGWTLLLPCERIYVENLAKNLLNLKFSIAWYGSDPLVLETEKASGPIFRFKVVFITCFYAWLTLVSSTGCVRENYIILFSNSKTIESIQPMKFPCFMLVTGVLLATWWALFHPNQTFYCKARVILLNPPVFYLGHSCISKCDNP